MAMDSGHGLSRRRHSEQHGSRRARRVCSAAIPGRPWRKRRSKLRRERSRARRPRLAAAGIDRVSLGVQSFVKRELARTGRRHTAEIVAADCAMLRDAGIDDMNIDLIAGLPHQTLGVVARIARLDRAARSAARVGVHV